MNAKDALALGPPAAAEVARSQGHLAQSNEVRDLARGLLDQGYYDNLKVRLAAGLCAPRLEVAIWKYAFGDPKTDVNERAHEIARFEAIRETVRQRIRAGGTAIMDAKAQGARRELRLAPQPVDEDDDGA
jgi:hypothetical protein